jgi:hypothetical protein
MFINEDSQDSNPLIFFGFTKLSIICQSNIVDPLDIPSLISMSFNKVCNSLSLCFVYLELSYKPFQTFIDIIELVVVMNIAVILLAGC